MSGLIAAKRTWFAKYACIYTTKSGSKAYAKPRTIITDICEEDATFLTAHGVLELRLVAKEEDQ